MGMYSSFQREDIKVVDGIGFVKFLYEYGKTKEGMDYQTELDNAKLKFLEDGTFSLDFMDGWKLIQYWYGHTCRFLQELGKYIEGYAEFEYETGDEMATIKFKDGKCSVEISKREWKIESIYDIDTLAYD